MLNIFLYPTDVSFLFFSPINEKIPAIIEGKFDYNESFSAFIKATKQKQETALMIGAFVNELQEKKEPYAKKEPIRVADFGCADGATCLMYFHAMNYDLGYEYIGFDTNQKFLDRANIELSQSPSIKKYELFNEDALSGKLSSKINKQFDIIFLSHVAYYLKNEEFGRIWVKDILNLLKDTGVAIFLHEDATYFFRSTYNPQYKNISAPELIKKSVNPVAESSQLFQSSFTSKLYFSELKEEYWEAIKEPKFYRKLAYIPGFTDTLNKLAFIVQCDLLTLAQAGSLSSYVDAIKEILKKNDNCFNLTTRMQVLVTSKYPNAQQIGFILNKLEKNTPSILKQHVQEDCQFSNGMR